MNNRCCYRFNSFGKARIFLDCRVRQTKANEDTMQIRYSCKDMGLNCQYLIKGETLQEVTQKALEHIQEKHSADFNSTLTPAGVAQMEQAISRSTRVVVS